MGQNIEESTRENIALRIAHNNQQSMGQSIAQRLRWQKWSLKLSTIFIEMHQINYIQKTAFFFTMSLELFKVDVEFWLRSEIREVG